MHRHEDKLYELKAAFEAGAPLPVVAVSDERNSDKQSALPVTPAFHS